MSKELEQLLLVLSDIIEILTSDGESHWKQWMSESKRRLLNSYYSGIERLLGAYGGMGSFNDLIICQREENGKLTLTAEFKEKNARLDDLRSQAWDLANYIKRNHEIKGN